MQSKWVYWLTCVLTILGIAAPSHATTIVMPTDDQLISKSPLIVEATVVSSEPVARGESIWTESNLSIIRVLKGSANSNITVREVGGVLGDRFTKIFGAPEYATGEHVLAFLTPTPRGDYQTMDLFVGKFSEQQTVSGQRLWTRSDTSADATLLDANFRVIEAKNVQRDGAAFEQYILDRVAGRFAPATYGVSSPVVASTLKPAAGSIMAHPVAPDFTMISEPSVYRWFAFDTGGTVPWYSFGTQPGYSGGGVNEVQTAMSAWTGYSGAKIKYVYSGTTTTSAGLSRPNGVNEIVFNDPNGEIAGSWNPSTGGVVGTGGFNGVSGSSSWTGPFDADATHLAHVYQAGHITEGNLVIQDNVSSTTGLSSARLAEIVAHELGHTLGFGHSADTTALMYYSVTGLGASLRPDDQLAARWLYPSGTVTQPPAATLPAAPSGLTGSVVGSSVDLRWIDNATNETGQSIYASLAGGAYSKVADVAAGQSAATLSGLGSGSYRFYVTAFNSAGSSATSNVVTVTVAGVIQSAFAVSPLTGVAGTTTFTFTDQSTGTITSRLWNFGDGTTSTAANPTHVYSSSGQFNATLTITGSAGAQSTSSRTLAITAAPASAPVAAFTYSPASPTTATSVTFTDLSTGPITSRRWDFGDGTSSTSQNPVKLYTKAGDYTVVLTVSNASQSANATRSIHVDAGAPAIPSVNAAFTARTTAMAGDTIAFTDQSTGAPASWSWSFGDGSTSTLQNPTHTYAAAGSYNVVLTVANAASSSILSKGISITPRIETFHALVPVSARTSGVAGTTWRTSLSLFNAGTEAATVDFVFVPGAGGSAMSKRIVLQPKQSVDYDDALSALFNLTSASGAITVSATSPASTPDLRISSRTFTGGGVAGSYGQGVPSVPQGDLQTTLYMAGLESDSAFRTNLGIINQSSAAVDTRLTVSDAVGNVLASTTTSMAPSLFRQASLAEWFPQLAGRSYSGLSVRVIAASSNAITAYASVVDNRTQDPVLITARPRTSGSSMIVPVIGRSAGANGTFWRSDVTLLNPTAGWLAVDARYLMAGSDNRAATPRTISIPPGRTVVLSDVISWLGAADGNGALSLSWVGTEGPMVTSRTYTARTDGGTFGQSIEPVQSFTRDAFVPGLRSDASFRANVGFFNSGDATIGVTVTLLDSAAQTLGTTFIQLPPRSQQQYSIASLFPALAASNPGTFALQAHTETDNLAAYGSIIDNVSGDPVYFAGR